jgi:hypothetical protein
VFDGDRLGEEPGQGDLPGTTDYPPEQPLAVEDPTMLEGSSEADDAMIVREWRRAGGDPGGDEGMRLVDPDEGLGNRTDDEAQAIAGFAPGEDSDLSAEEAAVHIDPES